MHYYENGIYGVIELKVFVYRVVLSVMLTSPGAIWTYRLWRDCGVLFILYAIGIATRLVVYLILFPSSVPGQLLVL